MRAFNCPFPSCGVSVEFHRTNCERGHFVGFPNIRRAEEMRADLNANYDAAIADAAGRGIAAQLGELETRLQGAVATLNVDPKILRNMSQSQNYISYYKALELGFRKIAERQYHAHRGAVDEKVHPGYRAEILNTALSPDGRGLTNYGAITLELLEIAIEDRASVMRENAFDFYERYDLGRRDAEEAPGWRSIWSDRARLGVAHLGPAISTATGRDEIAGLILFSGTTRPDDRYMEVQIFGELSWQSLGKVTLERPLTEPNERDDWDFASQKLGNRDVKIVDRTNP
jgi:hypothetical protein